MGSSSNIGVVLLSIKPQYSELIFGGTKKIEFRKVSFRRNVNHIFVYESGKTGAIVGHFKVKQIDRNTPDRLWSKYGSQSGISKSHFKQYYNGRGFGIAIQIKTVVKYARPISINELNDVSRAPQSFQYLTETDFDSLQRKNAGRHTRKAAIRE